MMIFQTEEIGDDMFRSPNEDLLANIGLEIEKDDIAIKLD
jgi:hypothetical protein